MICCFLIWVFKVAICQFAMFVPLLLKPFNDWYTRSAYNEYVKSQISAGYNRCSLLQQVTGQEKFFSQRKIVAFCGAGSNRTRWGPSVLAIVKLLMTKQLKYVCKVLVNFSGNTILGREFWHKVCGKCFICTRNQPKQPSQT